MNMRPCLEGTEAQEGERQWLRFEGLDTICDIYLNEEKIGNTYNMHRTWEFDVTGKVKAGENYPACVFPFSAGVY